MFQYLDISVGDLLGLGSEGVPVGYPVEEVISVVLDATSVFAEVEVRPKLEQISRDFCW